MYLNLQQRVHEAFAAFLNEAYGARPRIVIEQPPRPEFGELALPFAFELAKSLRRPPRQIAEEVASKMPPIPGVERLAAAGGGYVNVFLDRPAFAAALLKGKTAAPEPQAGKVIVEHTNINPNKAAHIGHLRNAVLGDTFVRLLRARGRRVEVQNYVDNTGVQVADVVVGFEQLENKTAEDVRRLTEGSRFDYYCWDLYARVSKFYEENQARLELRAAALQQIERGEGEAARRAEVISEAIVRAHVRTMERINVQYDLLPRESEILHLKFWEQAFEQLKARGAIYLETQGKNRGCWVMPAADTSRGPAGEGEAEDAKVIVRSNGTVTYVGKDIAYQLWKLGLLGRDFRYAVFHTYPDGHRLWMTTTAAGKNGAGPDQPPAFGRASRVYNVIDVRQSYLQNIVAAGLQALGYEQEARNSIHFAYEMVALSPRCSKELGIELTAEEQKRPFLEVSGRKGLGVKADDLLDTLHQRAVEEVRSRHPERDAEFQRGIARKIAVGALRFFLLKFTRNTVIAFDFGEALNFEGETGPYVQYAAVRAANILRKAGEPADLTRLPPEALGRLLKDGDGEEFWQLLLLAAQAEAAAEQALISAEPAVLARYAFRLAQTFNNFYHRHHILSEADADKKVFLLWLADFVRKQLAQALDWLGMEVPEVM